MALGGSILTWFEGRWHAGNVPILGAADHGAWLGTMVFDGARAFEGVTPDLDLHCARLIRSAEAMGLAAPLDARAIEALMQGRHPPDRRRPPALPPPDALVARGLALDHRRHPFLERARHLPRGGRRCAAPGPLRAHRLALPPPLPRRRGLGGQGRLPLSQQRPHRARGARPRLPERPLARPGGERGRDRLDQRLPGARRGGDDAGAERHLPRRHHPRPGHRAPARRRGRGGRGRARRRRLRRRGRDLPHRQRQQGHPGHPLRGPRARPGAPVAARARALYWDYAHQGRRAA